MKRLIPEYGMQRIDQKKKVIPRKKKYFDVLIIIDFLYYEDFEGPYCNFFSLAIDGCIRLCYKKGKISSIPL